MSIETGTLNVGQRYSLEDLRLVGWVNDGEEIKQEDEGYSPWSFFDEEDFYQGPDGDGDEPIFEYDTEEQPHF